MRNGPKSSSAETTSLPPELLCGYSNSTNVKCLNFSNKRNFVLYPDLHAARRVRMVSCISSHQSNKTNYNLHTLSVVLVTVVSSSLRASVGVDR